MGSKSAGEMRFWTEDQYLRFSDEVMDKPLSFHAFETLYWCGVREGELLALKPQVRLSGDPHHRGVLPAHRRAGRPNRPEDPEVEARHRHARLLR